MKYLRSPRFPTAGQVGSISAALSCRSSLRGRSAGSFLEQRLVIEPTGQGERRLWERDLYVLYVWVSGRSGRSRRFCKMRLTLRGISLCSKICSGSPGCCFYIWCKEKMQTSISKHSKVIYRHTAICHHIGTNGSVHNHRMDIEHHKHNYGTSSSQNPEGHTVLYRFKWTKQLRFISRVKIFHVAVVTSLIWPMSYWYFNGVITLTHLTCAITGATGTTAGLVVLSYFIRRVVGELSFDESTQQVTISSLTFWGNRCNRTFPLANLVPLSDSGINLNDTFHRLEVNGFTDVYLINLRNCKILHEKFCSVIGVPMDEISQMKTGLASKK